MRIALTALTPQGPRDVVVSSGDADVTVAELATALSTALRGTDRAQRTESGIEDPIGYRMPHSGPSSAGGRPAAGGRPLAGPGLAQVIPLAGHRVAGDAGSGAGGGGAGGHGVAALWVNGRQADPRAAARLALPDGAVVAVDPGSAPATAALTAAEPAGAVEIRLAGGTGAGLVHRLGLGSFTLGAAPQCDLRIGGRGVPGYAAQLTVQPQDGDVTVTLAPPPVPPQHGPQRGPQHRSQRRSQRRSQGAPQHPQQHPQLGAPLLLNGEQVTQPRPWPPGVPLKIGPNVLTVRRPEPPDAHLSPDGDGGLAYNRPPRLTPPPRPRLIEVPVEPKRGEKIRPQLFAAMIPLVLGIVLAKLMHQWIYALFMLMSPVMVLGQWASDRRHGRVSYQRALKQYRESWAVLDTRIAAERAAEEAEQRAAAPDPAELLLTATGPRRRLWERRARDEDALRLRIGLADLPSRIELVPERGASYDAAVPDVPGLHEVPVTVPLPDLGVLGLAGPRDASRALARWLVAQTAVLHSPRDTSIVVLAADPEAGQHWNWVRWLPHCAPRQADECVVTVGTDPDSIARRVGELAAQAADRARATTDPGAGRDDGAAGHRILVVLDGARALRRVPGMPQLLATAKTTGICAICLDQTERELPEECAAVVSWHDGYPGWVTLRGGGLDLAAAVLADQVGVAWADRVARALAPIRDTSREDGDAAIPQEARLLDVIGTPEPTPEQVIRRWQGGPTTAVPIGVGADGPFVVDLRTDGPHGLIAGTTGAGKSELLQTLIASLAAANRPDEMTFVLIDYKGGSAFKDCARLPHTVGMVTDLDGHLTERALASLSAELRRREEILLHAGAKDIEDYWDAQRAGPGRQARAGAPLPRLVLIIDEFASLVAELPDFVAGLVGIAQRGRSLGVHLILATQRPAGVVSADIRANTNLRIALRVTDAGESLDVIDAPDAARISRSTPGRCYVRAGATAAVPVQSARIGGRRPGRGPAAGTQVIPVPWPVLGRPLPAGARATMAADEPTMVTDLSVLVDAIVSAARDLGITAQRSPWLPPLPESVTLDTLPPVPERPDGDVAPIPFCLIDIPARQAREALAVDLSHGGHLVIAGAPRSGRSTALRTIAGSVAARCGPADVHLYGLDCGGGALGPLTQLPHCGAVVSRDQTDRVERLLGTLRAEISRRQQVLAAGGFAGVAEQRAACADPEQRLPWMLLLFDWWEGYAAAYEQYDYGRLIDAILLILREGPAVGLRAAVTTDRAALLGQVGTVFQRRFVLNLADKEDASYAGLNVRAMPRVQPPGRMVFLGGTQLLEGQVALLGDDPAGPAQVAALHALARAATARYPRPPRAQRPLRVDALPPRITAAETLALDPSFTSPSALWALVGAGGDELGPSGLDVGAEGPGLVVAGPPRSGRSTALLTMARHLLGSGTPVLVITPRRSPLRALAGTPGVLGVLDGADPAAVDSLLTGLDRYVVVVDDAEMLSDSLVSPALEQVLLSGRDGEHGVILAGPATDLARCYSGFIYAALKSRCGLFTAVEGPGDGDLFGLRLPRGIGPGPLGRGLLVRAGNTKPVQIALPE
jgi:DNA segregation ATPase FtsK/SpoIIIE, S-DNA-T family